MSEVEIVEVGPRDGVQSLSEWVPTERKAELVRALLATGVRRMEVGSFVSPRAIPQMRDIRELLESLGPVPGVRLMALVPNLRGARDAVTSGLTEIAFVLSMSEAHNRSNVRRSVGDSIDDLAAVLDELDPERRLRVRVDLATAFDCPFDGRVPEAAVLRNVERVAAIRQGMELCLCDTTGMALPEQVRGLAATCLRDFSDAARFAFHGHDTAGLGVANALAALEAGVRVFDTAVAGLGGCPFAPGATGNVATEDLVYVFGRHGLDTGIDLERYLDACALAAALPGGVTGGHVRHIGRERLLAQLDAA